MSHASASAASLWSASSSVGERSVRSARSLSSSRSSSRSSMGGGRARARLRAGSADHDGFAGSGSGASYSSSHGRGAGGTGRSDAIRLRLENALRDAEGGGSRGGSHGGGGGGGGGIPSSADWTSEGVHPDTTAPLNDAPSPTYGHMDMDAAGAGGRRRRARSHEDLAERTMGTSTGFGTGLYSSSLAREENRRRSEAYHDDLPSRQPARSRYSTGNFSVHDDDDDDDDDDAPAAAGAHGSSKSFGSEGSRSSSSVGLDQIAHSLDLEERYNGGLAGRSRSRSRSTRGRGRGMGMNVHAPSAKDILNGNTDPPDATTTTSASATTTAIASGGGLGSGFGFDFDDDGDRWAAQEQRWLHQQRDMREEEMRGVGVHRDADLHLGGSSSSNGPRRSHGREQQEEESKQQDEDRRLEELRRRSIGGINSSGSGGSGSSTDRRIRRSSMGQTVPSDAVPRVFAGSLASMGISISRNIADEIPEPAVRTPTTSAASRGFGSAYTPAASDGPKSASAPTAASDSPASFIPTSAQFNEQTNQLFSRLGSLGRTVGNSVGDAVSTALKNRQEQIKAQNRRAAAAASASASAAAGGGKKKSRSGSKGEGRTSAGGRQRRKRRNSARNARNSSRFFTPSVDGRGVLPQTITEGDEEEDDTLFSKLAIRGFNLARLVDETVPNAERLAAESSGDEFDDDDLDDEEDENDHEEEEEKKSQASGERDYSPDGSGFEHPDDPPIPPAVEEDRGPNYGNQSLAASMFPVDSYGEDDNRSTHWEVDGQADATTSFASRRSSQLQQQHRRSRLSDLSANNPSGGAESADENEAEDKEDDAKSVQSQTSSVRSSSSALSSKVAEWKREHQSGTRSVDGGGVSTRSYSRNRRSRAGSSASNPPGEVTAIPIMSQRQRGVAVGTAGASGGANALAIATKNLSRLADAQQQKKRNAAYAGGGGDSSASTGALDRMKKSTSGDSLDSRGSATGTLRGVGGGNSTWNFANK